MDFSLNEQQEMLRTMARDFLATECPKTLVREALASEKGYSPELWKKMVDVGWLGLIFPEEFNGSDSSFLDLVVLFEEMGRACLPSPFLPTVVLGGLTILDVGTEEQKKTLLPRVTGGDIILTLALTEPSVRYDAQGIATSAVRDNGGYVISGTKLFVPDAHIADRIICVARTGDDADKEKGITMFLLDARSPGIGCTVLKTITGDKQCELILDKVKVPRENVLGDPNEGWSEVKKVLDRAVVAKCAEMVGGAQQVMEMSVSYAKERVQYGHPIGSFQAIQHYCADMLTDVDGARFITYEAAWKLSEGLPATREIAMAKAWLNGAYRRVAALGQEIHGGIGFTEDHDMPLYFRQAKSGETAFGDTDFHRELVLREMGF